MPGLTGIGLVRIRVAERNKNELVRLGLLDLLAVVSLGDASDGNAVPGNARPCLDAEWDCLWTDLSASVVLA